MNLNGAVGVAMVDCLPFPNHLDLDPDFFANLANNAFFRRLPRQALPSRKLPQVGQVSIRAATRDENAPVSMDDGDGDRDCVVHERYLGIGTQSRSVFMSLIRAKVLHTADILAIAGTPGSPSVNMGTGCR